MFYSDQNRAVYETMRALYTDSEAVDIITLVNALATGGTFASADDAKVYITHIAETVPRSPTSIPISRSSKRSTRPGV